MKIASYRRPCALCGSENLIKLFPINYEGTPRGHIDPLAFEQLKQISYFVYKCSACGFEQINPTIKPTALYKLYQNASIYDYDAFDNYPFNRYKFIIKKIESIVDHGSLLDIGCAKGWFLSELGPKWGQYGVEPNKALSQFARDKLNLNVKTSDIFDAKLPENSFDVVVMFDVIEHLDFPRVVIEEIWRILKDRGLLVIETGNADSFIAKIAKDKWIYYNRAGHISFFSKDSLRYLLNSTGFINFEMYKFSQEIASYKEKIRHLIALPRVITKIIINNNHMLRRSVDRLFERKKRVEVAQSGGQWYVPNLFDHMLIFARKRL